MPLERTLHPKIERTTVRIQIVNHTSLPDLKALAGLQGIISAYACPERPEDAPAQAWVEFRDGRDHYVVVTMHPRAGLVARVEARTPFAGTRRDRAGEPLVGGFSRAMHWKGGRRRGER